MIIANCSLRFRDDYFSSGRVVSKSEVIIGRALPEDLEVNGRDTPPYTTEVCLPVSHYQ
jgi:hypothetical protein